MIEADFKAIADHALLVSFGTEINEQTHSAVIALDKAIADDPPVGVVETVPALVNLLVDFDPLVTDHNTVATAIRSKLTHVEPGPSDSTERVVQVCYDAPFSADLSAVTQTTGLSEDAVIKAHMAGDYKVLMYGFVPGYAYLGGVPETIQVPRKPTPVRDVPAGSVIIAGPQCLVTTLTMPTGWSVIGRSPTKILTKDQDRPFLFDIGDSVRFERIDRAKLEQLSEGPEDG